MKQVHNLCKYANNKEKKKMTRVFLKIAKLLL